MNTQASLRSLILVAVMHVLAASAQALEAVKGPVVLTISGLVTQANDGKNAVYSMDMLSKLPQQHFRTKTPWYAEPVEFSGPLLRDVLASAGAKGSTIVAAALNDYKTEIPFADAQKYNVIVALLMNGKPMPVREKGPLFIVYPFDSQPELRAEVFYNRSAWQLARLMVQ